MSEKLHSKGEQLPSLEVNTEAEKNLERLREAARNAEHEPQKNIEAIQKSIEAQAVSGKEINIGDKTGEQSNQSFGVTKHLKADAYRKTLRSIRNQLSAPDRALSRVIHQPTIETASNALSSTVARPSGFLGGSLFALVGSAGLLWASRHYGFTYNYTALFVLFAEVS